MGDPALLDAYLSKLPIVFLLAIAVIWMVTGLPRHLRRIETVLSSIAPALNVAKVELKEHVSAEVRGAESRIVRRLPEPHRAAPSSVRGRLDDGRDEVLTWGVAVPMKRSGGGNGSSGASA